MTNTQETLTKINEAEAWFLEMNVDLEDDTAIIYEEETQKLFVRIEEEDGDKEVLVPEKFWYATWEIIDKNK